MLAPKINIISINKNCGGVQIQSGIQPSSIIAKSGIDELTRKDLYMGNEIV